MNGAYDGVYEFENCTEANDTAESKGAGIRVENRKEHAAQSQPADQLRLQYNETKNDSDNDSTIEELEKTIMHEMKDVHIETSVEVEEEELCHLSTGTPTWRSRYIFDLWKDELKPSRKPLLLDRPKDSDLYDFLDVASRNCRYKTW